MNNGKDSGFDYIEMIKRKAPEYLDLITAKSSVEFEEAFDPFLGRAVSILETNKTNFVELDEVALSAVLVAALTVPGISVTQEQHSNGHVDITIEADHCNPARKKLGEAKIYDGPEYHFKGLGQLLGRYTTGREERGLLIVYFRKKDIANLVDKLRRKMDVDLPLEQQGPTQDYKIKWSFLSTHKHSCGENLEVSHIGCNLFVE